MINEEEIKPQLEQLKEKSNKNGFVTLSEIEELFPDRSEEFMDELIDFLNEKGIEINTDEDDILMDNIAMTSMDEDLDDEEYLMEEESEIKVSDFDSNDNSNFQSDDLVRLYLHEIGQIELLNVTEEVKYASIVQDGLIAEEKLAYYEKNGKELASDEKKRLEDAVKKGYDARNVLTVSNLKLVVSIARRYTNRGLELMDLIQEGNVGLMKAVVKFDPTRGYKFSTYAHWWIRQSINRAIADKGRTVRLPVHMHDSIAHLSRVRRHLSQELQREPTQEELAKEMNTTVEEIVKLQRYSQDSISFDSSIGDDDDSTLIDLVADENTLNLLEYTEKALFEEEIDEILQTLTPREEMVIRLRYGIGVDRVHPLEEVGTIMDLTRERVRQIQTKAILRLRQYQRLNRLKQHMYFK